MNEEKKEEHGSYLYSERRSGHVERSFNLEGIDAENITAKVQAEISTLDYAHQISTSAGTIPGLTSRKAGTSVSLRSGSALAIGGLLNSEDAKTVTKIPLLGDIPIIGKAFRREIEDVQRTNLLVFLTPRIIVTPEDAQARSKEMEANFGIPKTGVETELQTPPDQQNIVEWLGSGDESALPVTE